MRVFAIVSTLATFAALPSFALTISSAPPSRDAAPHLRPGPETGPRLQDTWLAGGRPSALSGASIQPDVITRYGFGGVQTTIRTFSPGTLWSHELRDPRPPPSLSPLSLSPPLPRR